MEERWAITNPTLVITFSVFAAMFWALLTGFVKPEAALLCGIVQMVMFPVYVIGAVILLRMNNGFDGNVFLYFAGFFAAVSGTVNVVSYFAALYHWPMDASIMGIVWLFVGIMLAFSLPGYKSAPWSFFLLLVLAALDIIAMGLQGIGLLPASLTYAVGTVWGIVSLLGLYCAGAIHLSLAGINLSMGKPLFK